MAMAAAAEQRQPQPVAMNHKYGNDKMVDDMDNHSMDVDDDDIGGGGKMQVQYEAHFQRPQLQKQNVVVRPDASSGSTTPTPAGPPPPAATSGTPFLACVQ
ncbi:hypothetical protein ABZP36_006303 [Zizania latifolia]